VEPVTPAGSDFIRFVEQGEFSGHLDAAVVSYRNPKGVRVDLISAIHVADPSYYEMLQQLFEIYDAVLYELVAPEDFKPVRHGASDSLISRFQRGLCRTLDLQFQLDAVDYDRPNFVHADLSPERFARIMKERGESFWTIFMRFFTAQMRAMQEGMGQHMTGPAMLEALRSPERTRNMKFLLAQEIKQMETLFANLDSGKKEGETSILVGERNRAAIEVLESQIRKGRKRLAIFYGAGHMPDMEARLQRDLGFTLKGREWIIAWDLRPGETGEEAGKETEPPPPEADKAP
jgi:hypothetical protein